MNKAIVTALVAVVAATAQAGSVRESADASSQMGKASLNMLRTSSVLVIDSTSHVATSASELAGKAIDGSVWVIKHPREASVASVDSTSKGIKMLLTVSGDIVMASGDESKAMIYHPLDESGRLSNEASKAVEGSINYTIDSAGRISTATFEFSNEKFGKDSALVVDASGNLVELTADSVVVAFRESKALVIEVSADSVTVSQVSVDAANDLLTISGAAMKDTSASTSKHAKESGAASAQASGDSFDASATKNSKRKGKGE